MRAVPGDHGSAGEEDRDRVRASHADRDQVIEVLKAAFVQGRLTKGELDARVGQALASRTQAELVGLAADIPAGPAAAPLPRPPARAYNPAPRSHTGRDVAIGLVVGLILAAIIVFGGVLRYAPFGVLAVPILGPILAVVPLVLIANSRERRSRRQLPPRPGQSGPAPEVQQPGQASHDPALPGERPDQASPDQARSDLRTDRSQPGRPRSVKRAARASRGVSPVPGAA